MAVVGATMVLIWPIADLPYGDDTAYTHMALNLARTGHMAYDGWEAVLQILHTYWGAWAIRLFGFSFTVVRLSTIPYALGAVAFCYLLTRETGLQERAAVFVTLILGLSPLFLPVAVSYMTDVPGLFFWFASLYFLALAADLAESTRRYLWLVAGTALGFIGGTGRQSVWFVPLVVLPYLAWARRKDIRLAAASLLCWVLNLGGVVVTMSWFVRQPYTVRQFSIMAELKHAAKRPGWEVNMLARFSLLLLLMCLPAALPLVVRSWGNTWNGSGRRKIIAAALIAVLFCIILLHPSLATVSWAASTLNWQGINGDAPLPGRPVVLTRPIRIVFGLTVYISACLLIVEAASLRGLATRVWRQFRALTRESFAIIATSLAIVAYSVALLLRAVEIDVFDRYLLPAIPWAAALLLLWCGTEEDGRRIMKRTMPCAWAFLGILALYGVLATQDLWSLARARVTAIQKLEAAGVPRTAIDGGFECNAWTELSVSGYLNNHLVVNPPGAYRPGLSNTPSVVPVYRLEYKPMDGTVPTEFGSVPYFSLLPPFHKQVSIDRVPGSPTTDR